MAGDSESADRGVEFDRSQATDPGAEQSAAIAGPFVMMTEAQLSRLLGAVGRQRPSELNKLNKEQQALVDGFAATARAAGVGGFSVELLRIARRNGMLILPNSLPPEVWRNAEFVVLFFRSGHVVEKFHGKLEIKDPAEPDDPLARVEIVARNGKLLAAFGGPPDSQDRSGPIH